MKSGRVAFAEAARAHPEVTQVVLRSLPGLVTPVYALWRADFDDWLETSLYLHPDTGVLVTRRHRFWRWFDFLWMLHIMDYDQRTDMNNGLLRASTVLAGITVASGMWLLYFSFRRRRPSVATTQRADAS